MCPTLTDQLERIIDDKYQRLARLAIVIYQSDVTVTYLAVADHFDGLSLSDDVHKIESKKKNNLSQFFFLNSLKGSFRDNFPTGRVRNRHLHVTNPKRSTFAERHRYSIVIQYLNSIRVERVDLKTRSGALYALKFNACQQISLDFAIWINFFRDRLGSVMYTVKARIDGFQTTYLYRH